MSTLAQIHKISVVIPIYNGERFFLEALETVFKQNYPDLEIIAVNDGSTDGSLKLLEKFKDQIKVISQENQGPSAARNKGIQLSTGSIVAFIDADDFWPDGRLRKMVEVLNSDPGINMVRGYMQTVVPEGKSYQISEEPSLLPFLIGSAIYKREVFDQVGLFDPKLRFGEDMDWLMRANEKKINIKTMEDVTLFYNRHPGNMTRVNAPRDLGLFNVIRNKILREKISQK
jgi:glycosyltransferase involved in cell wall biosynthesis